MTDPPKHVFVTEDRPLLDGERGVVSPVDEAVRRAAETGEGVIALTPELMQQFGEAALATVTYFEQWCTDNMTDERVVAGFAWAGDVARPGG